MFPQLITFPIDSHEEVSASRLLLHNNSNLQGYALGLLLHSHDTAASAEYLPIMASPITSYNRQQLAIHFFLPISKHLLLNNLNAAEAPLPTGGRPPPPHINLHRRNTGKHTHTQTIIQQQMTTLNCSSPLCARKMIMTQLAPSARRSRRSARAPG
jgi:hypothetical protein